MLHLRAFSQRERILDIDAEVAGGAGRLRSAERMGAVVLPAQSDPSDPFVDEPRILSGADVIGMINPAREGVVVESAPRHSIPRFIEVSENVLAFPVLADSDGA